MAAACRPAAPSRAASSSGRGPFPALASAPRRAPRNAAPLRAAPRAEGLLQGLGKALVERTKVRLCLRGGAACDATGKRDTRIPHHRGRQQRAARGQACALALEGRTHDRRRTHARTLLTGAAARPAARPLFRPPHPLRASPGQLPRHAQAGADERGGRRAWEGGVGGGRLGSRAVGPAALRDLGSWRRRRPPAAPCGPRWPPARAAQGAIANEHTGVSRVVPRGPPSRRAGGAGGAPEPGAARQAGR